MDPNLERYDAVWGENDATWWWAIRALRTFITIVTDLPLYIHVFHIGVKALQFMCSIWNKMAERNNWHIWSGKEPCLFGFCTFFLCAVGYMTRLDFLSPKRSRAFTFNDNARLKKWSKTILQGGNFPAVKKTMSRCVRQTRRPNELALVVWCLLHSRPYIHACILQYTKGSRPSARHLFWSLGMEERKNIFPHLGTGEKFYTSSPNFSRVPVFAYIFSSYRRMHYTRRVSHTM